MTREQIEQAIDENLDSIAFDSEGDAWKEDGTRATEADFMRAMFRHHRLEAMLRTYGG